MGVTLEDRIARLTALLNGNPEPAKYSQLVQRLSVLSAAKKDLEDDDDEEDDDEDEKKSKKSAKRMEDEEKKAGYKKSEEKHSEEKHSEEEKKASAKRSEKKSEEDDEEESEEKKSKAALALIESLTGQKGSAALGATAALFGRFAVVEAQTAELAKTARQSEKATLLASVKRHVPKAQIEWLETQKLPVVRGFVEQALKGAPMVHTEEGDLFVPNAAKPNTLEALPTESQNMIKSVLATLGPQMAKDKRDAFEAELIRQHFDMQAKQLNGAGGRY